ncbi:MAG: alpha/beta hydrolase [Minicystis sp.]
MAASIAPTFTAWRASAQRYLHRGHAISFHLEGEGPPLLILHGFPSAAWDFAPLWPDLTARFRVIAPDLLGFGDSAKPTDHDYTLVDQASMIEGLCAAQGIAHAHVLAHDYGDSIAQELLARHEARAPAPLVLDSVCFLNGGLFPEVHRARFIQRLLNSPLGPLIGRLSSKRTFDAGMRGIFGPRTPPSPALLEELWTLLLQNDGRRVLHRLIRYLDERPRLRDRWLEAMRRTRVPLRFIDGLLDPVSGAHMVQRARELLPDLDVVELPEVGHYPQIEDAPAVLAAFLAFHDRLASPLSDRR